MTNQEKIVKIQKYIEEYYKPDFDFEKEHWVCGNYDDSYSYGVDSGQQLVYKDIKDILDK